MSEQIKIIANGNYIPTTETANNARFLRNDNTWQTVTPGNIGAATSDHNHDSIYSKTDTKNTAGSTNTDSKIFLVGTTSQAANSQTYSDSDTYVTNGTLRTGKVNILDKVTLQYNSTAESLDFIFV